MKKLPLRSRSSSVRKVACTVSAAALMLGVSSGATIGLHFMENYCGAYSYTGTPVTMTAFGIAPTGWENLAMMQTGYGGCNPLSAPSNLAYTTNEVIDTTTLTNGLNPLPNGSLTVTWSANGANFSGFGGYGMIPIFGHPAFDGPPPVTLPSGEAQVYSTFLRDGVNFGVGSTAGDNTLAAGYSVDVVGLKSVFTNTPFVVELIASSDSIQYLTNAFVIDVTNKTTNSVTYPSTPFPFNNEDSGPPWFRGHGGGLSTVSGSLNTDHIQIMSNHPQHGTNATANGFDLGGTISGFIVTDKPLVTMSPQPVPVGLGDTVTWSAYAIGVPPLSYQWLKNGVPIPGATSLSFGLTNVTTANLGKYVLLVTNLYGSATSSVVSVDQVIESPTTNLLVDSNPVGPAHNGMNSNTTWLASFTDPNGTNRNGVMSFSGTNSQVTVPPFTAFNSTNVTVMFWLQTTQLQGAVSNAVLFDRYTDTNSDGIRIVSNTGFLEVQFGSGPTKLDVSTAAINDGNWHHVAVSYDLSGVNGVNLYLDGVLGNSVSGTPISMQPNQEVELGYSHNTISVVPALIPALLPFQGLMSDFRIYTTNLSASQIASVFSTGGLVDTNDLAMQLSFAAPPSPGLLETWQVQDGILQSAPLLTGPWTDVGVLQPKYLTLPSKPALFFRYRGHIPVTQVSNPYLM